MYRGPCYICYPRQVPGVETDKAPSSVCGHVSLCSLSLLFLAKGSTRNSPNVFLGFLGTSWKAHPTLEWDKRGIWGAGHSGKEGTTVEPPLLPSLTLCAIYKSRSHLGQPVSGIHLPSLLQK